CPSTGTSRPLDPSTAKINIDFHSRSKVAVAPRAPIVGSPLRVNGAARPLRVYAKDFRMPGQPRIAGPPRTAGPPRMAQMQLPVRKVVQVAQKRRVAELDHTYKMNPLRRTQMLIKNRRTRKVIGVPLRNTGYKVPELVRP
ncbi:hypothetical protein PMAYCL1PPCAC_08291, partial [Pristionchus mayeri]